MTNTNWEEEFNSKFGDEYMDYDYGVKFSYIELYEDIKRFITDLLEQKKIKWLEALPKEKDYLWLCCPNQEVYPDAPEFHICEGRCKEHEVSDGQTIQEGWNACLKEIKQQLTK